MTDIKSNGLCISRRSLQNVLHASLPDGCVTFGKPFKAFKEPSTPDGKVLVEFEDGSSAECDVLVGADGIRSKVSFVSHACRACLTVRYDLDWRAH